MNDKMYWNLRSLTIDKEMDIERDRLMHKSYLEAIQDGQEKKDIFPQLIFDMDKIQFGK
jgi:hypothetical protein